MWSFVDTGQAASSRLPPRSPPRFTRKLGAGSGARKTGQLATNDLSADSHEGSLYRDSTCKSLIQEYCQSMGAKRPICSVLIANNGIAAVKFIRSVRSWSYGTFGEERAVVLVGMATPEDIRANAEHIRMADQFVQVPGGTNNNNYANVQLIVEVAERTRVDAVWPGWGHASENPELPEALSQRGIVFLGPPARAMEALGDKVGSTIIAQSAGVPALPWSGSKVSVASDVCREPIPENVYREACVMTAEEAVAACAEVGYPAMIKASWGGGGKGIRKVHNEDEVRALFKQVQGEVPGSPIFIMKVASLSRHLEVQLLCDEHGNVATLHSRDCSVQRRHQKIIEEGPITIASPKTVAALEEAACRLAQCVGYVGAATVEYLYSSTEEAFYFLELNPRLQVEHPVTEWIAGVNLPASQLMVGMGVPLWRMPELRRLYGQPHGGDHDSWHGAAAHGAPFAFRPASKVDPLGHVVAARVTSEDPDDGFKPTSGRLQELSFRSKQSVWAYFSVKSGGRIHEFSDSQFGHLFAHGETRAAACANMVLALKEIVIRGEIRTNVDYSADLIETDDFQNNRHHTGWLDSRIAMRIRSERLDWHICVLSGALYLGAMQCAACVSEYIGYLQKGQIPPKSISLVKFQVTLNIDGVKYTAEVTKGGMDSYRLQINSSVVDAEAHTLRDGGLLVQIDGGTHVMYGEEEANGTRLLIDGRTCLLQNEHDPSRLIAETPCKLLRFLVDNESHVAADAAYAEVEVMKMCMPLLTPASGTIQLRVSEGQALQAGDLIATLELDDPSAVKRTVPFVGTLPELGRPIAFPAKVHQQFAAAVHAATMVLAGYGQDPEEVVESLLSCLDDSQLPLFQWQEMMAVLSTRLPKDLKADLDTIWKSFEESYSTGDEFPAPALRLTLQDYLSAAPEKDRQALNSQLTPLLDLVTSYEGGREGHAQAVVSQLFDEYLRVEELFSQNTQADVIESLRRQHKQHLYRVVEIVLSHQGLKRKNKLILLLLDHLVLPSPSHYSSLLLRLASLSHPGATEVAVHAAHLLEHTKLSELRASVARSLSELDMFGRDYSPRASSATTSMASTGSAPMAGLGSAAAMAGRGPVTPYGLPGRSIPLEERMEALVDAPEPVEDALTALFEQSDQLLQARAVEAYVRRLYQPYLVRRSMKITSEDAYLYATWCYWEENPPPLMIGLQPAAAGAPPCPPSRRGVQRWGAMVVVPFLSLVGRAVGAAVSDRGAGRFPQSGSAGDLEDVLEAAAAGRPRSGTLVGAPSGSGNTLHIVVTSAPRSGEDSLHNANGEEGPPPVDEAQLEAVLAEEAVVPALQTAGISVVSCVLQQTDGHPPVRRSLSLASTTPMRFVEQPLWRHVEPPLSSLLELTKLPFSSPDHYSGSRDRQWHKYSATDHREGGAIHRLFLRALVRQPAAQCDYSQPGSPSTSSGRTSPLGPDTPSSSSSDSGGAPEDSSAAVVVAAACLSNAVRGAVEELEMAQHENQRPDHVHIFMSILRAVMLPSKPPDNGTTPPYGVGTSASTGPVLNLEPFAGPSALPNGGSHAGKRNSELPDRSVPAGPSDHPLDGSGPPDRPLDGSGPSDRPLDGSGPSDRPLDGSGPSDALDERGTSDLLNGGGSSRRGPSEGRGSSDQPERAVQDRRRAVPGRLSEVVDMLVGLVRGVDEAHGVRMQVHGIGVWEVRVRVSNAEEGSGAWRVVVTNPSKYTAQIEVYREAVDPAKGVPVYFSPYSPPVGANHNTPLAAEYPALGPLDRRRITARRLRTTFCYDFPLVFEAALRSLWEAPSVVASCRTPPSGSLVHASELAWAPGSRGGWGAELVGINRPPAQNDVGMVAWRMRIRTPEYPRGRQLILVANDTTVEAGTFSPQEGAMFKAVTELACEEGLPLIYLAANAGARIGVAEEIRASFRVGWTNEEQPEDGFQYLYLAPEDFARYRSSVVASKITLPSGTERYIITDIIGEQDGLGVENLSGSGAIASAFNRAYHSIFTLTYVTGRSVGIGAYLARLGQRCIQRVDQPIILTGYSALNKLLGREVYTSHLQLGGPKVMATNGVSHLTVPDDFSGCLEILRWLAFIPECVGAPLPTTPAAYDPVCRPVEYEPGPSCDPRAAIRGQDQEEGGWAGGLFDRGSFVETLEGWAQTVVTGRARLGGVPVGVVAVETQTVMLNKPPDPGQPDMHEMTVPQAGQVWFPDSAAKTAQALQDFNREGLPLFILANWRGFSGGQRDLFEGILQAGSLIVENLRQYSQPVFVYIPKTGELRGGAWVVVDRQINAEMAEMYAAEDARGAVLEPEGVVEVKYRSRQLHQAMVRLDSVLAALQAEKAAATNTSRPGEEELTARIDARELQLLPVYRSIALRFADLHDTPHRMLAKGVIQAIVPWRQARAFFYKRLVRRVEEESLFRRVLEAGAPNMTRQQAKELVQGWFTTWRERRRSKPSPRLEERNLSFDIWVEMNKPVTAGVKGGPGVPGEDAAFLEWARVEARRVEVELEALREEGAWCELRRVVGQLGCGEEVMQQLKGLLKGPQQVTQVEQAPGTGG